VILRPGAADVSPAAFLFLASAFTSALYQIMSRKLASLDRAETSITYIALAGFVLTSIPLPFYWQTPASARDLMLFVGLGVFGGFGHYFLVRALRAGAGAIRSAVQLSGPDRRRAPERGSVRPVSGRMGVARRRHHRGERHLHPAARATAAQTQDVDVVQSSDERGEIGEIALPLGIATVGAARDACAGGQLQSFGHRAPSMKWLRPPSRR
jgi:hypothetical protein